jgi:hypothetical protein
VIVAANRLTTLERVGGRFWWFAEYVRERHARLQRYNEPSVWDRRRGQLLGRGAYASRLCAGRRRDQFLCRQWWHGAIRPVPGGLCLAQIKPEHIGDAVHPGSDARECAPLPRRPVISARPCSTISEYACHGSSPCRTAAHGADGVRRTPRYDRGFPADRADQPFSFCVGVLPG